MNGSPELGAREPRAGGLLGKARFLPLFVTQFLGAMNDNLFKNALVLLALYRLNGGGPVIVALAGGVFILPYVMFSSLAGQLADMHEKSRLIRLTKYGELAIMLAAAVGFVMENIPVLLLALFGLGIQAAFFSPLKYGILPQHLREDELLAGNGLIEAGTFVGILLGTIGGGLLIAMPGGDRIVPLAGLLLAAAGIAAAHGVPQAPPGPDVPRKIGWNIPKETMVLLREARANPPVWAALLGISWFWALGATLLAEFPTIARVELQSGAQVVTAMLTVFSVGVGLGSLFCARLLRGEISARLVPWAGLGISLFTADFGFTAGSAGAAHAVLNLPRALQGWRMLFDLLALSTCGGCYSVPLYAICQEYSAPSHRARMIAANNVLNAGAMALAAALVAAGYAAWQDAPGILILTSVINFGVAVWMFRVLPVFGARPGGRR